MRIEIINGNKTLKLWFPNIVVYSPWFWKWLIRKHNKEISNLELDSPIINPNIANSAAKFLRDFCKKNKNFILVEIESDDGEKLLVTL